MGVSIIAPRRHNRRQEIQTRLALKPINDLDPSAISLWVCFALSVFRTPAGTVQKAFGAHCYGTDTAGNPQVTLIARAAAFGPDTGALGYSYKAGVDAGKHRRVRIHFSEELDAGSASQGDNRVNFAYMIPKQLQEFTVALALHGGRKDLEVFIITARCKS